MTTTRLSSVLAVPAALALATVLAACSPEVMPSDSEEAPVAPDSSDGGANDDADDGATAGGGLEGLYADSLHDGVETAAAGTAYIDIEGERLDFSGVECTLTDRDGGEALVFTVEGETAYGTTELAFVRNIGWLGFDYEEELVQVTHLGGTGDRGEFSDISMAQNAGDEEGGIEWYSGDGPDPMARIVDSDVTAIGTLSGTPGSENPQEGDFALAANCG